MRLGVGYNIFDGIELLEYSVNSIRKSVDFITVVYQDISNFGEHSKIDILPILEKMKSSGLIDDFVKYTPNISLKGHGNEIQKRNIGLEKCSSAGCTHFITMDCDELYKREELEYAKSKIGEYDSSACMMQTYFKTAEFVLDPPEQYYVPLIYRMIPGRMFEMNTKWPIIADPTRRMKTSSILTFSREEIQMHHFSYVRKDIRTKLNNSSASGNFKNRIDEIALYFETWTPEKQAMLAGKEKRMYNVLKTENYFKITL